jgi:hypothetical protein
MLEVNETLEPTLDSGKSNGVVVAATSRWPGLFIFLIIVVLLLGCLFLDRLLLDYRLFSHLLPQERDETCHQGFVIPEILTSLFSSIV